MADELWARLGIPIGLAFFTINGATRRDRRVLPQPRRLDRVRARPRCLGRAEGREPGAGEPRARRRGVRRQPAGRPADPTSIVPIDECYRMVGTVKAAWEGISGGQRGRRGDRGLLQRASGSAARMSATPRTECRSHSRRSRRCRRRNGAGAGLRGGAGAGVRDRLGRAGAALGRADAAVQRPDHDRAGAAGVRGRADGAVHGRARQALVRRRASASASRSCSARRSAGPRPPARSAGPRSRRWSRASRAPASSRWTCQCTLRPRAGVGEVLRLARRAARSRSAIHFNGSVFYEEDGRPRPGRADPVGPLDPLRHADRGVAGDDRRAPPQSRLDPARDRDRRAHPERARPGSARPPSTPASPSCSTRRRTGELVEKPLETLVDSLLYEGYALYPYTPGATKNATPTPFGIVYPPAYAEGNPATFDHLRAECVLAAPEAAKLTGTRAVPAGRRASATRATERRLELPATDARGPRRMTGVGTTFEFDGEERIEGRVRLRAELLDGDLARVRMCVHNTHRDRRRRGPRPRRGPALEPDLDAGGDRDLAAGASSRRSSATGAGRRGGGGLRERQHLPGARQPVRHGDPRCRVRAARPSRRWRRRASATCSTTPRSRRRCCSTSTR